MIRRNNNITLGILNDNIDYKNVVINKRSQAMNQLMFSSEVKYLSYTHA